MKFSSWALSGLSLVGPGLFSVAAAQNSTDAVSQITNLVANIEQDTTAISAAVSTLSSSSTADQNASAVAVYKTRFRTIDSNLVTLNHALNTTEFTVRDDSIVESLLNVLLDDLDAGLIDLLNGLGLEDLDSDLLELEADLNTLLLVLDAALELVVGPNLEDLLTKLVDLLEGK